MVTIHSMTTFVDEPKKDIFDASMFNPNEDILVTRVRKGNTETKTFPMTRDGYIRSHEFIVKESLKGRMWTLSMMAAGRERK